MTIYTCSKCSEEKKKSEFRKDKTKKEGIQPYCKICARKQCQSFYWQQYGKEKIKKNALARKIMIEYVNSIRQLGCQICNENDPCCIDFHHLDPKQKDFAVSQIGGRSIEVAKKEIEKCIRVCSNCHRKIHAGKIAHEV